MAKLGSLLTSTSDRDFLPQGKKNEEIMIVVFPQIFQGDLTEKKKNQEIKHSCSDCPDNILKH